MILPQRKRHMLAPDRGSVGLGDIVGTAVGLGLVVGEGEMVGANSRGDPAQKGLGSPRSKHWHCAGEREKSHTPRPAQFAGQIDSGHVLAKEGQITSVPLGRRKISPS